MDLLCTELRLIRCSNLKVCMGASCGGGELATSLEFEKQMTLYAPLPMKPPKIFARPFGVSHKFDLKRRKTPKFSFALSECREKNRFFGYYFIAPICGWPHERTMVHLGGWVRVLPPSAPRPPFCIAL